MGTVQWGTVPAWLSAAAVPATLYIILRDRGQRQVAQASLVACSRKDGYWDDDKPSEWIRGQGDVVLVTLYNTSPLNVFHPKLIASYTTYNRRRRWPVTKGTKTVVIPMHPPGTETECHTMAPDTSAEIYTGTFGDPDHHGRYATEFVDTAGITWVRNCQTLELSRLSPSSWRRHRQRRKIIP